MHYIVGNPNYLFHHLWVHLVTFTCFQSNMHDLYDLFYPMKLRVMYACCSSVSEARFQTNMPESTCFVMECYEDPCFFTVIIFSMTEIVSVIDLFFTVIKCKRRLMVSSSCGFNFSTLNTCLIFALGAAILISLQELHLKGVNWLV